MRLGLIVNLYPATDVAERFDALKQMGLTTCQLVCWDPALIKDRSLARSIRKVAKEKGVTITVFWCGYGGPVYWNFYEGQKTIGLVPPATREERLATLIDGSFFAKELGVSFMATHVGFLPENPYDENYIATIAALKRLVGICADNQITFLFETGQETPVTLLRAIQDIAMPNVGINLDSANLILYGKANPCDAIDVFGRYVKQLHGKDALYPTDGRYLGMEKRLGEGKVNYPELLRKLKDVGFYGDITIEREIEEGEEQRHDILEAKHYLESILAHL
jgi:sugar phosphate isomerase/epimerase